MYKLILDTTHGLRELQFNNAVETYGSAIKLEQTSLMLGLSCKIEPIAGASFCYKLIIRKL